MNKKVLIVEDEKPLLNAASQSLERNGYDTYAATSAKEAIAQLESYDPIDAVWLDHYLLDQDTGLDLLEKMKKNKKWKNIPVFVVTNSVGDDKIRKYTVLGIEKYYIKAESSLGKIIKDIDDFFAGKEL